jgi:flagella basal body P-ring formation protein FlgA
MRALALFSILVSISFPLSAEGLPKAKVSHGDKAAVQSIPASAFHEILKDYMCQRLGKAEADIVISRLKVTGNKPVSQGEVQFHVFQKDKRAPRGYMRLEVLVSVDGVVRNRASVYGWVDVFEPVVCTTRRLKKGDTLRREDIYTARKNTSYLSPGTITDTSKALGFMAKHTIRADTPLKGWMLEKPPAVDRGDIVTILAESRDLRVTVPGLVLEKGYLGEVVMVRNTMSKKKIYAKVLDNSTVKVNF